MYYKRWYDNNENLRGIIEALKITPQGNLEPIALDIVQLMLEKQPDADDFLEITNKNFISDKHRWYDRNYMFHSVMEMLKHLSVDEIEKLLREMFSPVSYEI